MVLKKAALRGGLFINPAIWIPNEHACHYRRVKVRCYFMMPRIMGEAMPKKILAATRSILKSILNAGINPANLTVAFARACKKVGIEDFRFHNLRHTAASWLRMTGADLQDVALLLGHKDLRMSARYSHLSRQHLNEAVRRLDAVFEVPRPQSVPQIEAECVSVASPTGFEPVLPH